MHVASCSNVFSFWSVYSSIGHLKDPKCGIHLVCGHQWDSLPSYSSVLYAAQCCVCAFPPCYLMLFPDDSWIIRFSCQLQSRLLSLEQSLCPYCWVSRQVLTGNSPVSFLLHTSTERNPRLWRWIRLKRADSQAWGLWFWFPDSHTHIEGEVQRVNV